MDAIECIKTRRSVRSFLQKPIPHEVFNEIISAAAFAPSWKNTQIARYIIIEDRKVIDGLAEKAVLGFSFNSSTMKNSAALVLVTMVNGRSGFEKDGSYSTPKGSGWEMFDAGIASQTFCLAAHAHGVGTVIMGIFDENEVAKLVNIPDGQQLAAIICAGYPNQPSATPKRKATEELVSYI